MTDASSGDREEVPTKVLLGPACHLGEAPAYDPVIDSAWWFHILGRGLFGSMPGSGTVRTHELPVMASMLATVDGKRQSVAAEDGLYVRDRDDGRLRLHLPL